LTDNLVGKAGAYLVGEAPFLNLSPISDVVASMLISSQIWVFRFLSTRKTKVRVIRRI
jgi:hypothetical protein